jgi:sulfur relay (sulfurtransferase) complex TusBCD TusD component (DsrE family)
LTPQGNRDKRGKYFMHYVIPATWGPTDTTRASLPFIFAASALQAGDTVMIMLFHDAVTIAVHGAHQKMVPVGPPQRFEEVFSNRNARIVVCRPCAEARGISESMLIANCAMGGMNDFHAETSLSDCRVVAF